ncbi:bifunctional serine/threonine-protein kinase/formylglycine-generating enzyme family protein [Merismopedia glauca]|uniref:Serine/threonine protein kinase n=1 Tax=Merismopedia glauca CCAP 1448/3 TaxID=1296344 RepID=A0A2T1BYZ2_9CYAN|nr:bifunctional serine/threonine-protein kinase/formylglycine-generating enzyme family protein [Merismopedia glauca]PSB01256.1 serine/threonine protein kinase [Merismopedia glauca CCAP 1448/3]
MIFCLNPECQNPYNADISKFCQSCGAQLTPLLENRYRVVELLGRGGFSRTYLGEDTRRLNTKCVIKHFFPSAATKINPQLLEKSVSLFYEEAKRLLQLEDHPQIPNLFAYFEADKQLYLVQQLIEGRTLLKELQEEGCFNQSLLVKDLLDITQILQFIHSIPVIHRDLKPENIIRRHKDGKLVLIDFGISKQLTGTMDTKFGITTGTPGYAPQEQMLYGDSSTSSDLYALGATSLHLLTGTHPFYLYNPRDNCWLWREQLQVKGISINDKLANIIDKLLADLPTRYKFADELIDDLNSLVLPQKSEFIPQIFSLTPLNPVSQIKLKQFEFEVVTIDGLGKEINRYSDTCEYFSEDLGNQLFLEMVYISGGEFVMGSPSTEKDRDTYESPQHKVTLAPFFLGKYPISQAQWRAVANLPEINCPLNPDPAKFKGDNRPVESVSWQDAVEFCARLSRKTGKKYCLPSEAQWEYSCRSGTTTPFHFGETITADLANYDGTYNYATGPKGRNRWETTPIGSFSLANGFGLYDMHGNVWEWCADPWHTNYRDAPTDGNVWEKGGNNNYRVFRGGSWHSLPLVCRSAYRYRYPPVYRYNSIGFRVAVV